jgi:predicted nucleic acid-binding protein
VPHSVISELERAEIATTGLKSDVAKLTRVELHALKQMDVRLGRGERECLAIAKYRKVPLASNDRLVRLTCDQEGIGYLALSRLLRLTISKKVLDVREARKIVALIEREERTEIKSQDEIYK